MATVHPDAATSLPVAAPDATAHPSAPVQPKLVAADPATADRPSVAALEEANHAATSIAKLLHRCLCPNLIALTFRTIAALSHWPNRSK